MSQGATIVPRHLGLIMDGNRRWATKRGLRPTDGHRVGIRHLVEVLSWCEELGFEHVTPWMLSTDNLATRSDEELNGLAEALTELMDTLAELGSWRVRPLGDLSLLPHQLAKAVQAAQEATKGLSGMTVNTAIGYGGRHEIVQAVEALLAAPPQPRGSIEKHLARHLSTHGVPDPDLVIRTSGEQRTSGFLLWEAAYAEYVFCPSPWPDFSRDDLAQALDDYASRQRRYGS